MPCLSGMDKMAAAGKKIPGQGYVVGKICRKEKSGFFSSKKASKDKRKYDKNYYTFIYDILTDRRHPREKTPTLNHLKAKTVRLHSKQVQSIVIDTH